MLATGDSGAPQKTVAFTCYFTQIQLPQKSQLWFYKGMSYIWASFLKDIILKPP